MLEMKSLQFPQTDASHCHLIWMGTVCITCLGCPVLIFKSRTAKLFVFSTKSTIKSTLWHFRQNFGVKRNPFNEKGL